MWVWFSSMDEFGSVNISDGLELVNERYYKKYYDLDVKNRRGEDQCVLQHSNKVCVVCLAPSHPLVQTAGVEIERIEFQIGRLDRTSNAVSGRFKSGQKLTPRSPLCFVHTTAGDKYVLYSCVKGLLVEVNERLATDPSILLQKPLSDGFLAIVLPKHSPHTDNACVHLLSEENYKVKIAKELLK